MSSQVFKRDKPSLMKLLEENAGDILAAQGMQSEKGFIQHGNITCYEHSISVAMMSARLASLIGADVDMRSMLRGALLHDYFLYDWHKPGDHHLHAFSHAGRALMNARRDFALTPIECDVICKHMFPLNLKLPKYKESVFVTVADKVCALCETFHRGKIQKLHDRRAENGAG